MAARGTVASARTGRHEDARAEPDILFDTRRSGARSDAPSCGASLTEGVLHLYDVPFVKPTLFALTVA